LAEWEALYRLEPWGDDWVQTARLEAAIKNGYATTPVDPSELIPNEDNRPASEEMDDKAMAARWKQKLGF
jgi:hypothetical protein